MSVGESSPNRPQQFRSSTFRVMAIAWAIAIIGTYLLYNYTQQISPEQKPQQRDSVASRQDQPTAQPPVRDTPYSTTAVVPCPGPDELLRTKTRWIEFKGRVEEISERLAAASHDIEAWSSLVKELPRNDAGRRIAGSKTHVDQYRALLDKPRPIVRLVGGLRDTLQANLELSQKYLGQEENATPPGAAMMQELDRLSTEVETMAKEYRTDRRALETLVSETAEMAPASQTLEQAIDQRARELAAQYRAQLAAATAAAEEEAQRTMREANAKAIKGKADAEADRLARLGSGEANRIRGETEQRLKTMQAEAEQRKRADEAERLRTLAKDPQVQRKFSAFLERGYVKFNTSPGGALNRGPRPVPVSFGDLNSYGWLRNVETFARAMSRKPNPDYNVFNDRPTHAVPRTSADWEEMERLLEQFKTLAPVWVEMKLLEP